MSSTKTDQVIVLDTGCDDEVWAVTFQPDGLHILDGREGGIRRWRLTDGQEVGKQAGMNVNAISVSKDHKWIICGTDTGASMWDAEIREKLIEVEVGNTVSAVDISPDSTRFTTGTNANNTSIWSSTTGKRLAGPFLHDTKVTGIKFSPTGEQIVTFGQGGSIRILDSHNGDKLIDIDITTFSFWPVTPLAWSNDGQQIFTVSNDKRIKSFAVSTGSQLAESPILDNHYPISLASNDKFIATLTAYSISFLDASTLAKIGTTIEDSEKMWSIAISLDSSRIATGREDGKIVIRNLANFLPDFYGPFHASTHEEQQLDRQPSTIGSHDIKPRVSEPVRAETQNEVVDSDLLEVDMPPRTPGPQFDYDELSSPESSAHPCNDEVLHVEPSHAISQSSGAIPVTSRSEAHQEEDLSTAEPSRGRSIFKKWLWKKNGRDPAPPKPNRPPAKSRHPRSRPQSPVRADATDEGPSKMAAGQRVRRAVAKPVVQRQDKSHKKPAARNHPHKDTERAGKSATDAKEANAANDPSRPSAGRVHLTRESGDAIVALRFPGWMCFCSGTGANGTD